MRSTYLRRSAAIAGIIAMVAFLAACGDDEATAAPGFNPDTGVIKVGVVTPLTGPIAVIGKPLTAGNEVWFANVNANGGIAGKYKVEMVQEDSQYIAQNAKQGYDKIKGDVVMFAQLLGTPIVNAILPSLAQDNIVAAPASLDAEWVSKPNLLPIGGPYQIQAINAMQWFRTEGGGAGKKICTMAQNDVYGTAGVEGVEFAAKEFGFTLADKQTYQATKGSEATAQVQSLKDKGCEAVFIVSTPSDTGGITGIAAGLQFTPKWIGQSPSWIGSLAASPVKDYLAANFIVAGEGTEWGDASVPGMSKMIADVQKFKPDQQPDYYFAFGYNQARAVTQVLEKAAENDDFSREGIMKALNGVGTLTFDGLTGDYKMGAPADREPPRETTLFKVDLAKPFGLATLKPSFASEAAKKFEIKKG